MGKEGDLWDDTALIKAFDTSISKYKTMHGMSGSTAVEKSTNSTEENLPAVEADNADNGRKDSCSHSEHVQNDEEYSNLLNKYYELEDQRQQVIQQLHQYSSSNYAHPVSASEAPQLYDIVNCYCPYGCQNWVVPCNSSCPGYSCTDKNCNVLPEGSQNDKEDRDFVKTAMVAAERALSSLKKEPNGGTEKKLRMEEEDLDVVLNAWYSAGFHTGRLGAISTPSKPSITTSKPVNQPVDPMVEVIASGRLSTQPYCHYKQPTILNIDLELLASRIKNRLKLVLPFIHDLSVRYGGLETETEVTQTIESAIDMMVDTAMAICYNRLRVVAKRYAPSVLVDRMNTRAPIYNGHVFPVFISSLLSSIGPLRVRDGPEDMLIIYATEVGRMENYGRVADNGFDFKHGILARLTENLRDIGVELAPIDFDGIEKKGSFFSTIIPSFEEGLWNFAATVHHSHYNNEDILRAYVTLSGDDVSNSPFEHRGKAIYASLARGITEYEMHDMLRHRILHSAAM